jgi:hypothetical protein
MSSGALGCETVCKVSKFQGCKVSEFQGFRRAWSKYQDGFRFIIETLKPCNLETLTTGSPENNAIFEQTASFGERLIYLDIGVIP